MERKEMFEDFSRRVNELLVHSDEIQDLRFNARLKNGTRFSFDYDSDRFSKDESTEKGKLHPVSVFNAVVDIIAGIMMIVFMIVFLSKGKSSNAMVAAVTVSFVSFFLFFCVSAVYHLFDEGRKRTLHVLFQIRNTLLAISSALMCFCVTLSSAGLPMMMTLPVLLLFAALSVFFSSLGTKTGFRASGLTLTLMAFVSFAISGMKTENILSLAFLAFSTALPAVLPSSWTKTRTLGIFYLVTVSGWLQLVLAQTV